MTTLRRTLAPALAGMIVLACESGGARPGDSTSVPPATSRASAAATERPVRSPTATPMVSAPGVSMPATTPPAATATISGFVRPFEYPTAIGGWNPTPVIVRRELVTFSGNVLVASAESAWVDGCIAMDRTPIRGGAVGFVSDLRTLGRANLEPAGEASIDGHPALAFDHVLAPGNCSTAHLHVSDPIRGIVSPDGYIRLNMPARFIVADVDGTTIFVRIGAPTELMLQEALPAGLEFVASLRFKNAP